MNSAIKYIVSAALVLCLGAVFYSPAQAAAPQQNRGGQRPAQGQSQAQASPSAEAEAGIDFNRMMREVEALRKFSNNEAEAALQEMARDRQSMTAGLQKLRADKASLEKEVVELQKNYNQQVVRLNELEAIEREDIASRKTLEGATRMTAGTIRDRLALSAYTSAQPEMVNTVIRITGSNTFPSYGDIQAVTALLFSELEHISRISIQPGSVTLPDGRSVSAEVLRVGGMLAAAKTENGKYYFVQPVDGGRRLLTVQADIPSSASKLLEKAFTSGSVAFPVDFSEGAVYKRFVGQRSFVEHILAGGLLIWPILGLGIGAFIFGLIRYFKLTRTRFGNPRLLDDFFGLVRGNKLEEAEKLLEHNKAKDVPVYAVLGHMLASWGKNSISSMEKCRDEAIMSQMTPLEKGVPFVAIAAAVAPLLGLLGTVTGMIGTFDVITIFGNSDPKLLSGGISVALVTTELGLVTAIPLMFLHFALSRRVTSLVDDMEEKGAILIARTSAGGSI